MRRTLTLALALLLLVPLTVASDDNETDEPDEVDSSGSGSDDPEFSDDSSGSGSDSSGPGDGSDAPDEAPEPDEPDGSDAPDETHEADEPATAESDATDDREDDHADTCAADRDERIARAEAERRETLRDAEAERDDDLADARDREERAEAWGEYNETVAEADARHDREVARAHDAYDDCVHDAERYEDDEVEVEDDEDGFRFHRSDDAPGVAVDATTASSRVEVPGVEFETRIDSVLEYRDEDGNGAYDLGEPVVQRFVLRDIPPRVTGAGDARVVAYALGDGSLQLRYRPSGDDTKFDVVLDAFPFQEPDTRVAVGAAALTDGGLRVVEVDGAPAVAGTGAGSVGYLSWVQTVDVDGATHPVGWSVHVSQSEARQSAIIFWSYPRGELVVHDPVLGVTSLALERLFQPTVFAAAAAGTVAVAALGFLARRRKA